MKYGEHLLANIAPEYGPEPYLHYSKLDDLITELEDTKPSKYVCVCLPDGRVGRVDDP